MRTETPDPTSEKIAPFVKVTLARDVTNRGIPNGGFTSSQREDDPETAKLLAMGWTIIRRWEVSFGPNGPTSRDLPITDSGATEAAGMTA